MPAPSSTDHRSGSPLPELAAAITAGAVRLAAATASWLRLIAEFDERGGWHGHGILTCGHWLSWQCGLSPGAAREHVRVARALGALPLIEAAFADGRLSYSKVRALTRIAEPDSEAALLELALELTASQVERTVRQWRRAESANAGDRPLEDRHSFEHWWDETGTLTVKIRMGTEDGAAFLAAVDSVAERTARRERAAAARAGGSAEGGERPGRLARRRLAALSTLAEAAAEADRRPGDPPRREVVVHVDAQVLADDATAGRAYLEGGPALNPAQARRMLCEATVVTMLERDREPLAVGRRRRRATRPQKMALLRRDGGCARPGCLETRVERLHVHHMRHWLFGGSTDLSNLVLLCDRDHGLVHDQGLVMARVRGRMVVTAPDGRRVWGPPDAAFAGGLDALGAVDPEDFPGVHPIDTVPGRRPGRRRSARTPSLHRPVPCEAVGRVLFPAGEPPLADAMPANGERMDVRYVVDVLMGNRDLVRRLAAEAGVPAGT
ncbi:UNVERIFIED_ORG: HNH endonuclease [Bacillus sp. AZ43]